MYKIFILLVTTLLFVACTDDGPTSAVDNSKTVYSPTKIKIYTVQGSSETFMITNDKNGNIITEISENLSKKTKTYDSKNNLLTSLFQYRSDTTWVDNSRNLRTYDTNSNLLTDLTELKTNGVWTKNSRSTYTYDNSNRELSIVTETWNGTNWGKVYQSSKTYDSQGRVLTDEWDNLSNQSKSAYTYDAKGNILTELEQSLSNGQVTYSRQSINTYDSDNNKILELVENTFSSVVNKYRISYIYGNHHDWLSGLAEEWKNNSWVAFSKIQCTNNTAGKMLIGLAQAKIGDNWENSYRYTNSYNSSGKRLSEITHDWNNNDWQIRNKYIYTYDLANRFLTTLQEYYVTGVLFNGYQETNAYDAFGNMTFSEHLRYSEGAWIPDRYNTAYLGYNNNTYSWHGGGYKVEAEYASFKVKNSAKGSNSFFPAKDFNSKKLSKQLVKNGNFDWSATQK